jgi:DNA polymerase elongation subunit (family B)
VIVRGNATRINALFLREYFRQRHGIPEMPMVRGFEGGYTDIFFSGVARNVWHCDIASLYPSIMLQFDCFPGKRSASDLSPSPHRPACLSPPGKERYA